MNVEIGAEATQFPGKEYINGIAVAVWSVWRFSQLKAPQNILYRLTKLRIIFSLTTFIAVIICTHI